MCCAVVERGKGEEKKGVRVRSNRPKREVSGWLARRREVARERKCESEIKGGGHLSFSRLQFGGEGEGAND